MIIIATTLISISIAGKFWKPFNAELMRLFKIIHLVYEDNFCAEYLF